jgi:ribA/ribD-fused uncharacterized protein
MITDKDLDYVLAEKYLVFWNSIFSQWYRHPENKPLFEEGNGFYSAEHYMMYHKAKLFGDTSTMKKTLTNILPGEVKILGRKIPNFNESIWDKHKEDIVTQGNVLKFGQNPELKEILMSHNVEFVEGSPEDCIWGIGLYYEDKRCLDKNQWKGQNLLGKCLNRAKLILKGEQLGEF